MARRTKSTSSRQLPIQETRYVVEKPWEHQITRIEPHCPEIEQLFATRRYRCNEDDEHGYRLSSECQSLLGDPTVPSGGLTRAIFLAMMSNGLPADLARPCARALSLQTGITTAVPSNRHVAAFMASNTHGIIRHNLRFADLVSLSIEICTAFPAANLAFVTAKTKFAQRFHQALEASLGPVLYATADRCHNASARVGVVTPYGLAHDQVYGTQFDALFFLNAVEATSDRGRFALYYNGPARVFAFDNLRNQHPPRTSDLISAIFGFQETTVPCLGHQCCQIEVAWVNDIGCPRLRHGLTGAALHRRAIVCNPIRNRIIARLAKALANNHADTVQSICPLAAQATRGQPCSTLVVVADVEHSIELARLLPGWPLFAANCNLAGLSAKQQALFADRRSLPSVAGRAIVTLAALQDTKLSEYGAVVWGPGGNGLPELRTAPPICSGVEQKRLIWIDFDDRFHVAYRLAAKRRSKDYERRGWFSVGELPEVGRINLFLAERPSGRQR